MTELDHIDEPEAPARWNPTGTLAPYLGAGAVGLAAMVALVVGTTLPASGVFQYGLTFLGIAMGFRAAEELDAESENPVVRWIARRADAVGERFGVELYGISAATAFVWAEASSFSIFAIPLREFLANPIGTAISLLISWFLETITNFVWAALWWLQILRFDEVGLGLLVLLIGAGWGVLRVLELPSGEAGVQDSEAPRLTK